MNARRVTSLLALVVILLSGVLTGCGQPQTVAAEPSVTISPPTPEGMEEMAPEEVPPPDPGTDDCDRTASLRPFPKKALADAAVANIRNRGRLIVGLDIGSNLLSFRDPITGAITGFDVDIAGEVARAVPHIAKSAISIARITHRRTGPIGAPPALAPSAGLGGESKRPVRAP